MAEVVGHKTAGNGQAHRLDNVVVEIATMLDRFRKSPEPITASTDISRDLNMDSLAVMDLLMELEDRFDVSIPLNMVPEIATVGQLAQTICDSQKGA